MKIKQKANCCFAIRSIGENVRDESGKIVAVQHTEDTLGEDGLPINYCFYKDTILEVNDATAQYLLAQKQYASAPVYDIKGNLVFGVTTPEGELIPEGTLITDFEIVQDNL